MLLRQLLPFQPNRQAEQVRMEFQGKRAVRSFMLSSLGSGITMLISERRHLQVWAPQSREQLGESILLPIPTRFRYCS